MCWPKQLQRKVFHSAARGNFFGLGLCSTVFLCVDVSGAFALDSCQVEAFADQSVYGANSNAAASYFLTIDQSIFNTSDKNADGKLTVPIEGIPVKLGGSWGESQKYASAYASQMGLSTVNTDHVNWATKRLTAVGKDAYVACLNSKTPVGLHAYVTDIGENYVEISYAFFTADVSSRSLQIEWPSDLKAGRTSPEVDQYPGSFKGGPIYFERPSSDSRIQVVSLKIDGHPRIEVRLPPAVKAMLPSGPPIVREDDGGASVGVGVGETGVSRIKLDVMGPGYFCAPSEPGYRVSALKPSGAEDDLEVSTEIDGLQYIVKGYFRSTPRAGANVHAQVACFKLREGVL